MKKLKMLMTIAAVVLVAAAGARAQFFARDPGVRVGPAGAGGMLEGLTGLQQGFFTTGLEEFEEADGLAEGLGPRFNLDSCVGCHSQPATGGTSPEVNPQVAVATAFGALNTVPSFITLNGPVREARFKYTPNGTRDGGVHGLFVISGRNDGTADASGCNIQQENFAAQLATTPNNVTATDGTTLPEGLSAIEKFAFFMRFLAPPTPSPDTPGGADSIGRGRYFFAAVGCALCHTPALRTGHSTVAALDSKPVNLFSDLLVHNMGPGLADDILQGQTVWLGGGGAGEPPPRAPPLPPLDLEREDGVHQRRTAVHRDDLARNPARFLGGEERHSIADVRRRRQPSRGRPSALVPGAAHLLHRGGQAVQDAVFGEPRAESVHRNPPLGQRHREVADQRLHRGLGRPHRDPGLPAARARARRVGNSQDPASLAHEAR